MAAMAPDAYIVIGPYAWAVDESDPTDPILLCAVVTTKGPDWENANAAEDNTWEETPLERATPEERQAWIQRTVTAVRALSVLTPREWQS